MVAGMKISKININTVLGPESGPVSVVGKRVVLGRSVMCNCTTARCVTCGCGVSVDSVTFVQLPKHVTFSCDVCFFSAMADKKASELFALPFLEDSSKN